jgi:hypothetical protein
MTPENSSHSLNTYEKKPESIVRATYDIPFYSTRKRRFLKTIVVRIPTMNPIKIEQINTYKNLRIRKPTSDPAISKAWPF